MQFKRNLTWCDRRRIVKKAMRSLECKLVDMCREAFGNNPDIEIGIRYKTFHTLGESCMHGIVYATRKRGALLAGRMTLIDFPLDYWSCALREPADGLERSDIQKLLNSHWKELKEALA